MHLQPRLLSPFLILAVLCLPVAMAQQQPTVNLLPRVMGSEPGVPTVHVTVDRPRVPLGTAVTFTLTPASVITNSRYRVTLYFGDGAQQIMRETEKTYVYEATGTYTYSVSVKSTGGDNKPPQPPQVTLNATPVQVAQGDPVNFAAQLSRSYPNIQYRFFYGDGASSNWQDSPRSNHAYKTAGTYRAYVDIGDHNQQLGGSPRKAIEVTKVRPLSVFLTANPTPARLRQPVLLMARVFPANADTKYRFAFGDSLSTGWQTSPQTTHVYDKTGNYPVFVEAAQSGGGRYATATSAPTVVNIQSTPTPKPTARPTPTAAPTSSPTPEVSPTPNGGASPSPTPNSSDSPIGSTSPDGTPSPNQGGPPAIGGGGTSSPAAGTVSSPSNGSSNSTDPIRFSENWWKYLIIAALILFLVYQASALFAARPTFAAFSDSGVSRLTDIKRGVPIDFQLVLNRNVAAGGYAIETDEPSLVRNSGRFEERQVLEI